MRVLIVGIGGAGSRIADALYECDQKSRTIRCIDGIAVDSDAASLGALKALPRENLIFTKALDLNHDTPRPSSLPYDEIIGKLQSLDPGDIDAVIVTLGLGGSMADLTPSFIHSIRMTMVEPVFGLITLPCDAEGDEVLVRAADQIDALSPEMDAIILFDNELWSKRVASEPEFKGDEEGRLLNSRKRQIVTQTRIPRVYTHINRIIGKRISLILRAGEVSERPGSEVGEIALDAGEIVQTLQGTGLSAIGLARESLSSIQPDLIRKLRPVGHSVQEGHERASRIVAIGKKAVFEEMSVSCNIDDAQKALILIAGPASELNMRGYMAFRHWIDQKIGGFEVRAGDYPINSRFVVVAVILSGFIHIERVDALRALRNSKRKVG